MEREQELEWAEAQKIEISQDLVAAAKEQLQFLAQVDGCRYLYDGPALDHAIYRYKYCWLPLLAKHVESLVTEGPLVVPLDCEWIWQCHRLNPVRYKNDCEELYGKILDKKNADSSVSGTCKGRTEKIWKEMYPNEPYELSMKSTHFPKNVADDTMEAVKTSNYDLVSAVKRQTSFFYQVSRLYMNNDLFLEGAVARYKGFLHLIKRNYERSIRCFCVPTYDIDLIWHSHQLHPASYCKDLMAIMGKVLEHDDTDSDRNKGKKLDVGFSGTTKQWEETFGSRYWRAGATHRGNAPSPLKTNLNPSDYASKKVIPSKAYQSIIKLPKKMLVEVMLEIVGVRGLLAGHKGNLFVTFSKKQPDMIFNTRRRLSIFSETGEKDIAVFQCEPNGELVFELMSYSPSPLSIATPAKMLGTTSISLQELMNPISQLWVEKWFESVLNYGDVGSKPINLRIALSFTPPTPAPYFLHMVQRCSQANSCVFPPAGRLQHTKSKCVVDEAGNEVISIQMRDSMEMEARDSCLSKREVIGMVTSGHEKIVLAEFVGVGWSLMNSNRKFQIQKKFTEDGIIFELTDSCKVIIFPGRKLEYEIKNYEKQRNEHDFMTAVEFSREDPYGKAVALIDLKYGFLKINEEWLVLPMIVLAFLLSETLRKESYGHLTTIGENLSKTDDGLKEDRRANQVIPLEEWGNNSPAMLITAPYVECTACGCCGAGSAEELFEKGIKVIPVLKDGKCSGECGNDWRAEDCGGARCAINFGHGDMVKNNRSGGCGGCGGCSSCGGGCSGGGCSGGGCRGGGCGH